MVQIKLRYLVEDVDRHGNPRIYVRRPGHPKIRIRGTPGSAEFMAAYHQALAGIAQEASRAKVERIERGSLDALCRVYYASSEFKTLDGSTQAWRRRALDKVCLKYGKGPAAQLEARHIRAMREEIAATPAAANHRLKALKALYAWAVEAGEVERNPARDVKLIRYKTDGHHTWTLEEVERFELRHPIGTKPRLAMALMLYTTCRREDVTRLGPAHVRAGRIRFTQGKNEHRAPVEVDMPVHPDLSEVLAVADAGAPTFLVTAYGKPFSVAGFGNWFRERCDEAALPHCSAHGLRKATAARLAERGATAKEIMAITGHQSLEEVEVYTRRADNAKLADAGMLKLTSRKPVSHRSGSLAGGETKRDEKSSDNNDP